MAQSDASARRCTATTRPALATRARHLWLRASAGRELLKLSDRTLEDLGLSRDGIRRRLLQVSLKDLRRLLGRD